MRINNRITEEDRKKASRTSDEVEKKDEEFTKKKKKKHFVKGMFRGIVYHEDETEENKDE